MKRVYKIDDKRMDNKAASHGAIRFLHGARIGSNGAPVMELRGSSMSGSVMQALIKANSGSYKNRLNSPLFMTMKSAGPKPRRFANSE